MSRKAYHKKYSAEHYQRNKEAYKARVKKKKEELRKWLFEYKRTLKCDKCDETHLACLEFHHRNPEEKDLSISQAVSNLRSVEKIKEEISKCDVLCANCHRKVHWELESKYQKSWMQDIDSQSDFSIPNETTNGSQ